MLHQTDRLHVPTVRRRLLLSLVSCATLGVVRTAGAQESFGDQKVVYHDNGGSDAKYFSRLLTNLRNHVAAVGKAHIDARVVNLGDGVNLLLAAASDDALAARIDDLRAEGVRFLVCRTTLRERKIDWHSLYGVEEADLVASGMAEIVRLEQLGFAYVHP